MAPETAENRKVNAATAGVVRAQPTPHITEKRSASDAKGPLGRLGVPVPEAAFRNAVHRGDAQVAGLLVDSGISVDTMCPVPEGYITASREISALLSATMHGHVELSLTLIQRGAQVDVSDQHGTMPLIIAAHRGRGLVVEALLQAGADIEAVDADGSTALMKAAEMGYSDVVGMLIRAGADLDKRDCDGRTALFA